MRQIYRNLVSDSPQMWTFTILISKNQAINVHLYLVLLLGTSNLEAIVFFLSTAALVISEMHVVTSALLADVIFV